MILTAIYAGIIQRCGGAGGNSFFTLFNLKKIAFRREKPCTPPRLPPILVVMVISMPTTRLAILAGALVMCASWAREIVTDFQQCDRDCRWVNGFFNRTITGKRVDVFGLDDPLGRHCQCYDGAGNKMGGKIDRLVAKTFDDADYWCGNFSTDKVCAMKKDGTWITTTRALAASNHLHILHCGMCSACSSPSDLMVIYNTRKNITTQMTKCSTAFAKPKILGGSHDLDELRACLRAHGITFSDVPFGENGPTCMDCWTDNIMCDSNQCKWDCIEKFFDPNNDGKYAKCLKCDETHCGPAFIKCAGANRRSSGIISDIDRAQDQVCTVGHFIGCSHCHGNCKNDTACNAKCEQLDSCQEPLRQ